MSRRILRFRDYRGQKYSYNPPRLKKFITLLDGGCSSTVFHLDIEEGKIWREYTCNGPSSWAWAKLPQKRAARKSAKERTPCPDHTASTTKDSSAPQETSPASAHLTDHELLSPDPVEEAEADLT